MSTPWSSKHDNSKEESLFCQILRSHVLSLGTMIRDFKLWRWILSNIKIQKTGDRGSLQCGNITPLLILSVSWLQNTRTLETAANLR